MGDSVPTYLKTLSTNSTGAHGTGLSVVANRQFTLPLGERAEELDPRRHAILLVFSIKVWPWKA